MADVASTIIHFENHFKLLPPRCKDTLYDNVFPNLMFPEFVFRNYKYSYEKL